MITVEEYADNVYEKYEAICGGFPCGKCLNIAKEIKEYFEGDIIGGMIGDGIEHWWFETKYGEIIDPMYKNERHIKIKIYQ